MSRATAKLARAHSVLTCTVGADFTFNGVKFSAIELDVTSEEFPGGSVGISRGEEQVFAIEARSDEPAFENGFPLSGHYVRSSSTGVAYPVEDSRATPEEHKVLIVLQRTRQT